MESPVRGRSWNWSSEETGRCPEEKNQKLTEQVMSKWYASCTILQLEKEQEPEKCMNLHIGGTDEISCQHLQVIVTNFPQKHWEWHEEKNPVMRHGRVARLTNVHGKLGHQDGLQMVQSRSTWPRSWIQYTWIIAAFLREMSRLTGKATFESVEKQLCLQSMFAARTRGSAALVAEDVNPDFGQSGGRMDNSLGCTRRRRNNASNMQFTVSRQLLDHIPLHQTPGAHAKRPHWRSN